MAQLLMLDIGFIFFFAINLFFKPTHSVAYPGIFFRRGGGGFQQIQLRSEGRENGDLGAVGL
jgi:hypothetical protein